MTVNIENVFSSKVRMKILKVLAQVGELNVSEIARRLNANFAATSKHLKILENEGILQHKAFGRIRLYRFKPHSSKARALQDLIAVWEHPNKK